MIFQIRFSLILAGYAACLALAQVQADPLPSQLIGRVLILEGDRTLEGDIQKVGDHYCIRRGESEVCIPAARVIRLCTNREEAFEFMCSQTNRMDPIGRLRMARWCQLNGLKDQALMEARAALAMRPDHQETQQFLAILENWANTREVPMSLPQPSNTPVSKVDISSEAMVQFQSRIQPLLLNACARCHNSTHPGSFQLGRYSEEGSQTATRRNLAAVLSLIALDRPQVSPLLIKAVSVHDGSRKFNQAPLPGGKNSPAFLSLDSWVNLVVSGNPHLKDEMGKVKSISLSSQTVKNVKNENPKSAGSPGPENLPGVVSKTLPRIDLDNFSKAPSLPEAKVLSQVPGQGKINPLAPTEEKKLDPPSNSPHPRDFFDPNPFNWQYHKKY